MAIINLANRSSILRHGVDAGQVQNIANHVKPEVYKKIRKEFCDVMDEAGLNYNFRVFVEGSPESLEAEPDLTEEWACFMDALLKVTEAYEAGDEAQFKLRNAEANLMALDYTILECALNGVELLIPELREDGAFTIEKIRGCNAFRIKGGGYILPKHRRWILESLAEGLEE